MPQFRAACHRDSPHCRVKRVTHPQDEPVGVTATNLAPNYHAEWAIEVAGISGSCQHTRKNWMTDVRLVQKYIEMFIVRKPFCLCQDILTMPHPANCQDSAASADLDFRCGKSVLFFLFSLTNPNLLTVIIVPTIALRDDIKRRAEEHGILCSIVATNEWNNGLLLLTPEAAAEISIQNTLISFHASKHL
ncbi:hypothetical protein EMCRGX_G023231 [Ephydatia muelleri]